MNPRSKRRVAPSRLVAAGVAISLALLPACLDTHSWVEKEKPWTQSTLGDADRVHVERSDGSALTLDQPRIGRDEKGEFLSGRVPDLGGKELRLDLSSVRTLEVWERGTGNLAAAIAAGIVVAGAIVLYLLHGESRHAGT